MRGLRKFIVRKLWPRLELPIVELLVHFLVTLVSILTIAGIEGILHLLGLDRKLVPLIGGSLGDWMFVLEVVAASAIILVGVGKAIYALVRE